jgi:hypothetical protein
MHFQQHLPDWMNGGWRVCSDFLALSCNLCFGCKRGRVLDAGMQQLMTGNAATAQAQQPDQAPLLNPLRYDLTELAGAHKGLAAVCLETLPAAQCPVLTCS